MIRLPLGARKRHAGAVVLGVLFFLALTRTVDILYLGTTEHQVTAFDTVLAGESTAPNQYRILMPVAYAAVRNLTGDPLLSDRVVTYSSIVFCFACSTLLFYQLGQSFILACIGLIALAGCLTFGMWWKYRQEFLEIGFTAICVVIAGSHTTARKKYALLTAVSFLAALNRETFIFALIGFAGTIVHKRREGLGVRGDVIGLVAATAAAAAGLLIPRIIFGWRPYGSDFWMVQKNLVNVSAPFSPYNGFHMGAGIIWLYLMTAWLGGRTLASFIAWYAIPFGIAAILFSSLEEHRIFYPLMMVLLAGVIGNCRQAFKAVR